MSKENERLLDMQTPEASIGSAREMEEKFKEAETLKGKKHIVKAIQGTENWISGFLTRDDLKEETVREFQRAYMEVSRLADALWVRYHDQVKAKTNKVA